MSRECQNIGSVVLRECVEFLSVSSMFGVIFEKRFRDRLSSQVGKEEFFLAILPKTESLPVEIRIFFFCGLHILYDKQDLHAGAISNI